MRTRDIMTRPVHVIRQEASIESAAELMTATADTDVAEVADTMLQHDVRSMPVVEGDEVVGIISRRDILRAMVRSDDVLLKEVQHRLDEYADGVHRWTAVVDGGIATVVGEFRNDTERAVVTVLARTVPGVSAATVKAATAP
jgi:CBS domain-containing protein